MVQKIEPPGFAFMLGGFIFFWQLWRQIRNLRYGARNTRKYVEIWWNPSTEIELTDFEKHFCLVSYDWLAREKEIIFYRSNHEFEICHQIIYKWNRTVRIDMLDEDRKLIEYSIHRYNGVSYIRIEDYSPEGDLLRVHTHI